MIRTVTLNTGFDETIRVGEVDAGGVADLLDRSSVPSGKGVNCARVVRALGQPVVAYALVGEAESAAFRDALEADGVHTHLVSVPHRTRTNITIASATASTHYKAAGFSLTDGAPVAALMAALERDIEAGDLVSLHGSTPDGVPVETWSLMAATASQRGATVVADVYGTPLLRVLERGHVFACKPNAQEIAILPGVTAGEDGIAAALRALNAAGVDFPLVSAGASGLFFIESDAIWQASLGPDAVVQFVGAGDACVAGLVVALAAGVREPRELVRAAIAAAAAHVEGTRRVDFARRASALAARARFHAHDERR